MHKLCTVESYCFSDPGLGCVRTYDFSTFDTCHQNRCYKTCEKLIRSDLSNSSRLNRIFPPLRNSGTQTHVSWFARFNKLWLASCFYGEEGKKRNTRTHTQDIFTPDLLQNKKYCLWLCIWLCILKARGDRINKNEKHEYSILKSPRLKGLVDSENLFH